MTVQEKKLSLIKNILNVKDMSVLRRIETALKDDEFSLSEAELASINIGLKQLEEGKKIPHKEVRKKYEKWL